ncbi:MAG: metallophosphoesterase [Bacillota bacterium]
MRILATADLHYNHPRSRRLADQLIDELIQIPADVLLLIGDTASGTGEELEHCLHRFDVFPGPKLFVAGNHELWTRGDDSYRLFKEELPRRIAALGWRWLQDDPFVADKLAIVGSVGWYDYSFAEPSLGIPRRFYEQKIAPGSAAYLTEFAHLLESADDIAPAARDVHARWNDGRFVKLHRSDEQFLTELITQLDSQLHALRHIPHIVVAMHHLPFREMLPPPNTGPWEFAKAFLGSERLGQILLQYPNVRTLLCGHTHLPHEAHIPPIHALNIDSGYRYKTYKLLDIPAH